MAAPMAMSRRKATSGRLGGGGSGGDGSGCAGGDADDMPGPYRSRRPANGIAEIGVSGRRRGSLPAPRRLRRLP